MFKKTTTVSAICASFTKQLEAVQSSEEAKASTLHSEIQRKQMELEAAQNEAKAASTAISNIRNLFGGVS